MRADRLTFAMIIAQAQALQLTVADATTGECADCQCAVCVSIRGLGQAVEL